MLVVVTSDEDEGRHYVQKKAIDQFYLPVNEKKKNLKKNVLDSVDQKKIIDS